MQETHARTKDESIFTKPHYFADSVLSLDERHDAGLLVRYKAKDMPRWASRITLKITDVKLSPVDTTSNWVWVIDFEVLGGV